MVFLTGSDCQRLGERQADGQREREKQTDRDTNRDKLGGYFSCLSSLPVCDSAICPNFGT